MKLIFDKSFAKDLEKIHDAGLLKKIEKAILDVKSAPRLSSIKSLKKLSGYKDFYRIRIDNSHRIGIRITEDTVTFIILRNRKDIYRYFP
jgi:mRNA interferase RelE/StbE